MLVAAAAECGGRVGMAAGSPLRAAHLSGVLSGAAAAIRCLPKRRGATAGRGAIAWVQAYSSSNGAAYGAAAGGGEPAGPRVCILGGGFGGLYTAVKLEGLIWPRGTKPRITLIDQGDRFVFKPLLYELLSGAASEDEVAPTYAQLLAPFPVAFRQAKVASVQLEHPIEGGGSTGGGTVQLADGSEVPYDWLVVALGAETTTRGVPGVRECALLFSTYTDALRLKGRLELLQGRLQHPEVLVVGGGYAGVETAAVLAELLAGRGRIKLITSGEDILAASPQGQREAARAALQDRGVAILTGAQVSEMRRAAARSSGDSGGSVAASASSGSGSEAEPDLSKRLVYLKDKEGQQEILEADLVVWSAGQAPAPKVEGAGLQLPFPTTAAGATQTDTTLRVLGHQRVFALGDVAVSGSSSTSVGAAEAEALPATAQVAFQQADYAAWNLWAAINGRPLLRFSYQHLGDMMSLGSTAGAVAVPIPLPPPLAAAAAAGPWGPLLRLAGVRLGGSYGGAADGVTLEGPLAAAVRRAAYLYRQPTDQQRLRVAASWAQQVVEEGSKLTAALLSGRLPGAPDGGSGSRSSS